MTNKSEIKGWITLTSLICIPIIASLTAFTGNIVYLLYAGCMILTSVGLLKGFGIVIGSLIIGASSSLAITYLASGVVSEIPALFSIYLCTAISLVSLMCNSTQE